MDRVKISYLAAGFVKNETIIGHTVTNHTIEDITIVVVYDKKLNVVADYMFRDVFRIGRRKGKKSATR
jgi:hypothetical protein